MKSRWCPASWAVSAMLVGSLPVARSDAQQLLFNDGIEHPFATPAAIAALKEDILQNAGPGGLAALPANIDEVLPHISWWGYRFERGADSKVTIRFVQRYDSAGVVNALRSWISTIKKGGCSFVNPSDPTLSIQPKQIDYRVGLSGKKRTCGSILGVNYATDLASIDGHAQGTLAFAVVSSNAVANYTGKIELQRPTVDIDVSAGSILGINVNSVVGQLVKGVVDVAGSPFGAAMIPTVGVPAWAISSEIDASMREARGRASDAAFYLDRERGRVDPEQYNRTLATSQTVVWRWQPSWAMSDTDTRFVGDIDHLGLEIVFTAPVPDFGQVEDTVDGAAATLRQLRGYSARTITVIAQRGDSWSRLAQRHYGSGFLAAALRSSQAGSLPARGLRIGQAVLVPPMWKVTAIPDHYVVRPGDTYEGICRRREFADWRGCVMRLKTFNPSIIPRRLTALSVLRIAASPQTIPSHNP